MIRTFSLATPASSSNDTDLLRVGCRAPKRLIFAVWIGLFAGMSAVVSAQQDAHQQSPVVELHLPPYLASEAVQIDYFLIGPFGGYGLFVTKEKGRVSYDIPASVDGKPAETAKIIAYLPGCEIVKLEITMQGASQERALPCNALGQVPLHGRIVPVSLAQTSGTEVEISYEADWSHGFFGIADGMVTTFQIATVIPDDDGHFEVELPDFFKQTDLGKGSFQFMLRKKVSGNIIAILKLENTPRFGLEIRSTYAPFVSFSPDTSISTPPSADAGLVEDRPYN
jgi:hypothetical protein